MPSRRGQYRRCGEGATTCDRRWPRASGPCPDVGLRPLRRAPRARRPGDRPGRRRGALVGRRARRAGAHRRGAAAGDPHRRPVPGRRRPLRRRRLQRDRHARAVARRPRRSPRRARRCRAATHRGVAQPPPPGGVRDRPGRLRRPVGQHQRRPRRDPPGHPVAPGPGPGRRRPRPAPSTGRCIRDHRRGRRQRLPAATRRRSRAPGPRSRSLRWPSTRSSGCARDDSTRAS